jgi:hypothetical protein
MNDQTPNPKSTWSGTQPVPKIGTPVGIPFHQDKTPAIVCGYFDEVTPSATYLGVHTTLLELPPNADQYGFGQGLLETIQEDPKGPLEGLLSITGNPEEHFRVSLFGAELAPEVPEAKWHKEDQLDAKDEFVALLPFALGGKEWQDDLTITAWCNGAWHSTPFHPWSSVLQHIRNTGHFAFVKYALAKNKSLAQKIRDLLKPRRR